jgi:hypothetical protein
LKNNLTGETGRGGLKVAKTMRIYIKLEYKESSDEFLAQKLTDYIINWRGPRVSSFPKDKVTGV